MDDTFGDPTMIMGLHGVLDPHPWVTRAIAQGDNGDDRNDETEGGLEEDVFSLAVKRAEAYGWSTTTLGPDGELDGARWGHNDAGGDWTVDGRVREAAWLQIAVAEGLRGQRLPVLPVATVLGDILRRVGAFRLTGLHALLPTRLAPGTTTFALVDAADWFAMTDPHPDAPTELTVTVAGRGHGLSALAPRVGDHVRESAFGLTTPVTALPPDHEPGALAHPLTGQVQTRGMRPAMAFRCRTREWAPDVAAWTAEVFLDALRAAGVTEPVLLTVATR